MSLLKEMPPYDEMQTLKDGFNEGRRAAKLTERLMGPRGIGSLSHEERWHTASYWTTRFEDPERVKAMRASEAPEGAVSMVKRLHSAKLWPAWRAGYLSGLVSGFAEVYTDSYRILPEEARALGAARGHALVYGASWPRRTAPHEVASGAVEAAMSELRSGEGPSVMGYIKQAGLLGEYRKGLLGALDEAVQTYLHHSGRFHVYVPSKRASAPGEQPRRRRRPTLRVVHNRSRARSACLCGRCS